MKGSGGIHSAHWIYDLNMPLEKIMFTLCQSDEVVTYFHKKNTVKPQHVASVGSK